MEYFIEGLVELLFGMIKEKPDTMSQIEPQENFTVGYNKKYSRVISWLMLLGVLVLVVVAIFGSGDLRSMAITVSVLLTVAFLALALFAGIRYTFTADGICKRVPFARQKQISWSDVICVRVIEETDKSEVIIALYTSDKKCFLDALTKMENAWQIVKSAEKRGIQIRKEKDLSIKQINRL